MGLTPLVTLAIKGHSHWILQAHFPSLQRRGVCGINQKTRSHRSAADGVVAHTTRFTNAFRNIACERPPRPRLFQNGSIFANGAASLEASPYRARASRLLCKEGNAPKVKYVCLSKII